jgi:hypothetical protein
MSAAQATEPVERVLHDGSADTVRADAVTGAGLGKLFGVVVVILVVATAVGITSTATAYFIKRV